MSEQSERSPIQLQDMTLEKGQKQEVQEFQDLPQQQQRDDDHEEEEHTSTSLKASYAITEQTREEQPGEQEEKKEDDEDKEVGIITVSPPSETPVKESERFPIQDMSEEKEGPKQGAQTLQELPQQQTVEEKEEDTAATLNASHAGEQTIAEQPKEPEQGQEEGKEQEAQNLQELPQQQQREEEEEEEEDTATSHYNASNAREQEKGQEDVDISSSTLPLMMKMNKWRLSPVTPAKRPAQKSGVKDEDCQGIKKKTRTKVTFNMSPTTFLESVLTDVDYEIGFLNCIIDYYHNNARYPYYDYIAVDDFIKNWLEVDATQRQLFDVILKLRKKYKETLAKMGVAKKFSDPCHQRAFNLAQRIWTNSGFKEDWKNLKKSRFIASPFP